jgi:hypothetical protein
MVQEFREKIAQYKRDIFEREEQDNDRRYKEFEDTFNTFMDKLKELISKEAKKEHGMQSSVTLEEHEDPPEIDVIKKLLGKLKSLIPKKWWTGWLRDILDKILENLSPQKPEEFQRLLLYVEEVYEPALRELLAEWRKEMRMEAYEKFARAILKHLIDQELKKL